MLLSAIWLSRWSVLTFSLRNGWAPMLHMSLDMDHYWHFVRGFSGGHMPSNLRIGKPWIFYCMIV